MFGNENQSPIIFQKPLWDQYHSFLFIVVYSANIYQILEHCCSHTRIDINRIYSPLQEACSPFVYAKRCPETCKNHLIGLHLAR